MVRAFAAALCLCASPAFAGARGTFTNQGVTYKVVDGAAYERKAEFGDGLAVRVALSKVPLDAKAIADAIDVAGAVAAQRPDGTYLDMEFGPDGSWGGMTYMLGSGNGCGWCAYGNTGTSTVKIENGVLRGTLKVAAKDYSDGDGPVIDLAFDLPVARAGGGTPLPADGGDPARVLLACRAAAKAKDVAVGRTRCFDPSEDISARAFESAEEDFWSMALIYGRTSLQMPTLSITGGRTKGQWAELQVEGKDESGQAHKGSVYMRKLPGGWRYHHEDVNAVY